MTAKVAESSMDEVWLEGEDGEIMETVSDDFKPMTTDDTGSTSDEEPPEEILNVLAEKKVVGNDLPQPEIDLKLCVMCQKIPHKYRCPKCDMRTCSMPCSKLHKEVKKCDGIRPPYQPVSKLSQFDASKSVQDQQFLYSVKSTITKSSTIDSVPSKIKVGNKANDDRLSSNVPDSVEENVEDLRYKANTPQERYLMQNALRRRIWLSFTDDKGGEDSSRHEQFSDTIFWCVDFIFTKQLDDGTVSEYNYRVQNIPETIRIKTILRQFLKPRQHGCIVSKSDLDLEKMTPFIEGGIESLNGFMPVPNYEPERFYGINFEKDLLHNTRNRVIVNHPKIIITLDTEFISSHQLISELEAEDIREKQRLSRAMYRAVETNSVKDSGKGFDGYSRRGGRSRGGRRDSNGPNWHSSCDFQRDNRAPRGGFKESKNQSNRKRACSGFKEERMFHECKKSRGAMGNRRKFERSYRSLDDDFDPFEPFEGPVRLPQSYLGAHETNSNSDEAQPKKHCVDQNDAIRKWGECIAQKEN